MKSFYKTLITLFIILSASLTIFAQDDTTQVTEDSRSKHISDIIKEVNRRSAGIDLINSEGEIKIKTPKVDESGSIEIRAKKKDDLWFKI
ncbi:MAG: hypothetical protein ACRDFC_01960 [Ignavibacteria bacterium]